jgi:hypothetical protein
MAGVVQVRLTGAASDVIDVWDALQHVLRVHSSSHLYANRDGDGVRCYLDVSFTEVPS